MEPSLAATSGIALLPERAAALRTMQPGGSVMSGAGDAAVWGHLFGSPALGRSETDALDAIARRREVGQGESLFNHSTAARSLIALRQGDVALGLRTADGLFRTERIVRGPAWLDLNSAWLAEAHAMDAQASSPATVLELPCDALKQELALHPMLATRLIEALAREVRALAVNTHELMHKDAPARLAQWLRQRCEPGNGRIDTAVVHLHERKRDVASQLAITPETLSRLMRSFSQQGVIEVAGYTVRVLDVKALGRLAEA
jgi:CRP-like cAMP-binding protein